MYKCSMCKNQFDGEPSLNNSCGVFCADCKLKIHARAIKGMKERIQELNGHCLWCGEKITQDKMQGGKSDENVCRVCSSRRDWLLKVIRFSDRPARYVARTEKRERPMREERQKVMKSTTRNKPTKNGKIVDELGNKYDLVYDSANDKVFYQQQKTTVSSNQDEKIRQLELLAYKLTSEITNLKKQGIKP